MIIEATSNITSGSIPSLYFYHSFLYNTLDTQCFYRLCDATTWRHSRHHGIYTTYTLHLRVSTHSTISTLFTITILTTYINAIIALTYIVYTIYAIYNIYTTHYLLCVRAREREIERVLGHKAECRLAGVAGAWLGNKQLRVVSKHHSAPTHHTPHQHAHCLRGMVLCTFKHTIVIFVSAKLCFLCQNLPF